MRKVVAAYSLALLALSILGFLQFGLSMQAMDASHPWGMAALSKSTLFLLGLGFVPVLLWIHHRWPPRSGGWRRHLAATLTAMAIWATFATSIEMDIESWIIDEEIFFRGSQVAFALGEWMIWSLAATVPMLMAVQAELRQREHQALRLEAGLAEARLQALTMQIHPHFLFNTLTAISVLVHRDPVAADAMLSRLSVLLRATIDGPSRPEITLGEEMALLRQYLEIMRFRFGPRLTVEEAVDPRLEHCLVPPFLLQPLVENALEHGIGRRAGPGRISVTAADVRGRLWLTVTDDGVGLEDGDLGDGVGLPNTIRRLNELYGAQASLILEPVSSGGTRVTVELPHRSVGVAA